MSRGRGADDERVVVVPRARLFPEASPAFRGVLTERGAVEALWRAVAEHWRTLPRAQAETDPGWKQIIPYVVLRRGGDVFAYRRLRGSGEARLRGLWSLGVGGHMNDSGERPFERLVRVNLERELQEEVRLMRGGAPLPGDALPEPRLWGFINDDDNPVGAVHLGALYVLELPPATDVRVAETDKLEGGWRPLRALLGASEAFETWSSLAIEVLSRSPARPGGAPGAQR
ncbi:MAG: hypothetical protein IMW98_01595 [Firmicutes bacterium]|nr:hypothetical protein [Bacillota bacterium]